MHYNQLVDFLKTKSDEKFAKFSKTLSNSDYIVIGVKNPVLRQFIKEHINDSELVLEDFEIGKYLEVDFIYFGLGINRQKTNKDKLSFLLEKIKYARSWAITDTASTYFKKLSFEEYEKFFLKTYISKFLYERRMAYVLDLKVYKEKEILKILSLIKQNEEYMVMMAEAWLLSSIAIIYPQEVYDFLLKIKDETLIRKTISKISDSYRFDEKIKLKFKELRNHL